MRKTHNQRAAHRGQGTAQRQISRYRAPLFASACLLMAGASLPAFAAEADADGAAASHNTVETVLVTARKREEDVQKVPIAITAFQETQLREGKLDEVGQILQFVPNVSLKRDQFTSYEISIRGSARNRNAEEPGVGLTRDGVYVGGLLTNTSTFYDLERVEVLRGPQGGLYGRNAVGGAVNFITAKPAFDRVAGYINTQYGTLQRGEVRAAANLPISDSLAVRVSGLYVKQDEGFYHVVNLGQYADAYRNTSGRVRVRWAPVEGLESLTTVETYSARGPTGVNITNPFDGPYTLAGQTFPGGSPDTLKHLQLNVPPESNGHQTQLIEELNYNTDLGTLTGVVGYRTTRYFSSLDNDGTALDISDTRNIAHQNSTYGDVRFSSRDFGGLHFVVGASYLKESLALDQQYKTGGLFNTNLAQWYTTGRVTANSFRIPVGTPITALGLTPVGNSGGWSGLIGDSFPVTAINHQNLKSWALYFEGNYRLNSVLEVWANLRYTHDDKSIFFSQTMGNDQFACPVVCIQVFKTFVTHGIDPTVALSTTHSFKNFAPGAGVNYTLSDRVQLYGKVVTGFKAGGFNSLASSPSLLAFDPETTISYEVGAKSNWLDHRLLLNADVFYQKRKDALVALPDPLLASIGVSYGVNAGLIENKGFEFEARAVPIPGLDLQIAGGYLDSTFSRFVSGGVNFTGNTVPGVYRYSLSAIASYKWALTSDLDGFTYLSYSNSWKAYTNADNARASTKPELLNGRLGVKGGRWNVIGFVDNITDHRYAPFENYVPGRAHTGSISPGRTAGIEVDYKF